MGFTEIIILLKGAIAPYITGVSFGLQGWSQQVTLKEIWRSNGILETGCVSVDLLHWFHVLVVSVLDVSVVAVTDVCVVSVAHDLLASHWWSFAEKICSSNWNIFARMGEKRLEIKNLCNHLRIVSIDRSDLVISDFKLLMYQRNTLANGMRRDAPLPKLPTRTQKKWRK